MVGRKPASVTRTVYKPGARLSSRKIPWGLVSRPSEAALTAASGTISTVAPICGVPAESRTTPESLPAAVPAGAADVFAPIKKEVSVRARAPQVRRRSCFTGHYLPGAALAALLVSSGAFTVKSAVLETDLLDSVSVATTSREYFPGTSVAR